MLGRAGFLTIRTQVSWMNSSTSPTGERAFEASPGGSASDRATPGWEATVFVFFGGWRGWGVDRAALDRNPSSSRWTCSLRELSSLRRSSVAASPAREWLASPLLARVLSSILASKVLRLCSMLLRIFHLFKQSGLELHAGAFVPFFHHAKHAPGEAGHLGGTTCLRVNDPPLFSTVGTEKLLLLWLILTFLGSDLVSSQKVGVDCTIDNEISLCLPREMAHFLSLGCTSRRCCPRESPVATDSFGVSLMRTWLRTPVDAGPARDVTPTLFGESTAYTFIVCRRHSIVFEFLSGPHP